jgi:hypothetical protein
MEKKNCFKSHVGRQGHSFTKSKSLFQRNSEKYVYNCGRSVGNIVFGSVIYDVFRSSGPPRISRRIMVLRNKPNLLVLLEYSATKNVLSHSITLAFAADPIAVCLSREACGNTLCCILTNCGEVFLLDLTAILLENHPNKVVHMQYTDYALREESFDSFAVARDNSVLYSHSVSIIPFSERGRSVHIFLSGANHSSKVLSFSKCAKKFVLSNESVLPKSQSSISAIIFLPELIVRASEMFFSTFFRNGNLSNFVVAITGHLDGSVRWAFFCAHDESFTLIDGGNILQLGCDEGSSAEVVNHILCVYDPENENVVIGLVIVGMHGTLKIISYEKNNRENILLNGFDKPLSISSSRILLPGCLPNTSAYMCGNQLLVLVEKLLIFDLSNYFSDVALSESPISIKCTVSDNIFSVCRIQMYTFLCLSTTGKLFEINLSVELLAKTKEVLDQQLQSKLYDDTRHGRGFLLDFYNSTAQQMRTKRAYTIFCEHFRTVCANMYLADQCQMFNCSGIQPNFRISLRRICSRKDPSICSFCIFSKQEDLGITLSPNSTGLLLARVTVRRKGYVEETRFLYAKLSTLISTSKNKVCAGIEWEFEMQLSTKEPLLVEVFYFTTYDSDTCVLAPNLRYDTIIRVGYQHFHIFDFVRKVDSFEKHPVSHGGKCKDLSVSRKSTHAFSFQFSSALYNRVAFQPYRISTKEKPSNHIASIFKDNCFQRLRLDVGIKRGHFLVFLLQLFSNTSGDANKFFWAANKFGNKIEIFGKLDPKNYVWFLAHLGNKKNEENSQDDDKKAARASINIQTNRYSGIFLFCEVLFFRLQYCGNNASLLVEKKWKRVRVLRKQLLRIHGEIVRFQQKRPCSYTSQTILQMNAVAKNVILLHLLFQLVVKPSS